MFSALFDLRSRPPLQRGAIRAAVFFVVLIPVTALFDYIMGTPIEWSIGRFVEMGVASVLYAALMHYFGGGAPSSDQDQRAPTTRSPR